MTRNPELAMRFDAGAPRAGAVVLRQGSLGLGGGGAGAVGAEGAGRMKGRDEPAQQGPGL